MLFRDRPVGSAPIFGFILHHNNLGRLMLDGDVLSDLVRYRTRFNDLYQHIIRIGRRAGLQIIAELAICVRTDWTSRAVLENDQWTLAGCFKCCIPFLDGLNFL